MKPYAICARVEELLHWKLSDFAARLRQGFLEMGLGLTAEQEAAWSGAWHHLKALIIKDLAPEILLALEYQLPAGNERIDVVILGKKEGKPQAFILELKGWREARQESDTVVWADGKNHRHPEQQALNYINKLKFGHSAADLFEFAGTVWLYNLSPGTLRFSKLKPFWANQTEELARFIREHCPEPLTYDEAKVFLEGHYRQTPHLFQGIRENYSLLREKGLQALHGSSWEPSGEQYLLIHEILKAAREGKKVCFLIQGGPGSGKTYVALLTLLEALRDESLEGNRAVLGYRNNRLLNTLRQVFRDCASGLDIPIWFYAPPRGKGLAVGNPESETFERFRVVLCDEAQRLPGDNIRVILHRGPVVAFFYDERQILNEEEEGRTENFKKAAEPMGFEVEVREWNLQGIYRVRGGRDYHDFVEKLLAEPKNAKLPANMPYEFRVFSDIREMRDALCQKAEKEGRRVALVAAFTEAPGDRKDRTGKTLKNLRIGYPLHSGFERYKGMGINIYWLMDERDQYPRFWYKGESNQLTHCASIYGCQGFEADYVGIVWGRDLVWRGQDWELGEACEDTVVYKKRSLKQLMEEARKCDREAQKLARELLINRYRIFLTRGILGTFVYCEDDETAEFLRSLCS